MKYDVIGFGAANVDYIYKVDKNSLNYLLNRYPLKLTTKQEKQIIRYLTGKGLKPSKFPGGSAFNTIYSLSKMGYKTAFVGKIANDEDGHFFLNSSGSVEISHMIISKGTTGKAIILTHNQNRHIFISPHINNTIRKNELNFKYFENCKIIHISSFLNKRLLEIQTDLANYLKNKNIFISFSPGCYVYLGLKTISELLSISQLVFFSKDEIETLTEGPYNEAANFIFKKFNPKIIIVTLGGDGAFLKSKNKEITVKTTKIKPVDTTGAGDVFAAGFIAGLLNKYSLYTSMCLASKLAAKSIEGIGNTAYPSKLFLKEVVEKMLFTKFK